MFFNYEMSFIVLQIVRLSATEAELSELCIFYFSPVSFGFLPFNLKYSIETSEKREKTDKIQCKNLTLNRRIAYIS